MRRSELKRGDKPLTRRTPLARAAGPRVSSLKSTTDGKGKRSKGRREAASEWHAAVVQGPCVMCAPFPFTEQERRDFAPEIAKREGHHLIPKQALRREGHADAVWDRRGGICLCQRHHALHELHVLRLPRSLLPVAVFEFAAELGLEAILDREYPVVEQHPLNNAIEEAA